MTNDISDPEERDGYRTITLPYTGNDGFQRAITEWVKKCRDHGCERVDGVGHEITILRVFQGWHGITIVYRKGDGKP